MKTLSSQGIRVGIAALAAIVFGIGTAGCTAKEPKATGTGTGTGTTSPATITVDASDTACRLSAVEAGTGPSTFVITNNGTKVTEFYVYGEGERVLGEAEDISPGLQRKLVVQFGQPGTYRTACKPGMVGDGMRADFTIR
ncbi:MAG: cupredoxin domain-containing protein [Mycobacterium sp.]